MALKRGKITRKCCTTCGSSSVTAYQADPKRPLDVIWVCRRDRAALIDELTRQQQREAEKTAWLARQERCDRELHLLPPEVQNAVKEAAARGPGGIRLSAEAPLYRMQLVQAFERLRPD